MFHVDVSVLTRVEYLIFETPVSSLNKAGGGNEVRYISQCIFLHSKHSI